MYIPYQVNKNLYGRTVNRRETMKNIPSPHHIPRQHDHQQRSDDEMYKMPTLTLRCAPEQHQVDRHDVPPTNTPAAHLPTDLRRCTKMKNTTDGRRTDDRRHAGAKMPSHLARSLQEQQPTDKMYQIAYVNYIYRPVVHVVRFSFRTDRRYC